MDGAFVADRVGKAETRREREAFAKVRNAEHAYATKLRQVARHIGDLVKVFDPDNPGQVETLTRVLERYADILRPWAKSVAAQMLADVSRRDETAWSQYARFMGLELRQQLRNAPVGHELARLLDDQVDLITSLPLEAARRVQKIALSQLYTGQRANTLAEEILRTGAVTRSRAETIARTETSRAASGLTTIRAQHIGCTHFVWRTARDWKVRPLHKKLDGTVWRFDEPPIIGENGEKGLPGTIYNCRCIIEPILK
jgi:SPP1 gp7 family putative phage head morphogenesis protein